jgi:predicted DNA-binding transcriptional regulator AlpA
VFRYLQMLLTKPNLSGNICPDMSTTFSTFQVAKKLGISKTALSRYILAGKVEAPPETMAGGIRLRLWTEEDIERLREALPKIANGRKTRYQKLRGMTQPRAAGPHKTRRPKKK